MDSSPIAVFLHVLINIFQLLVFLEAVFATMLNLVNTNKMLSPGYLISYMVRKDYGEFGLVSEFAQAAFNSG